MRRIRVFHDTLTLNTERTSLSSAYTSGTSLSVLNNFPWAANDLAVVGEVGEEQTELKKVDSITGNTTLTLASALKFAHATNTSVYKVPWSQVSIEGRATSADAFAVITTTGIQWDKLETIYYHTAGTSAWEYRFRFYNDVTAEYSEYSPSLTGAGFSRNQAGFMINNIRRETQDIEKKVVTDSQIFGYLNDGKDIIAAIKADWWFTRFEDSSLSTTAGTVKYSLSTLSLTNLGSVEYIKVRYDSGGSQDRLYRIKYLPPVEFDFKVRNKNAAQDDNMIFYTLLDADSSSASGYFEVWPIPKTTGKVTFYIGGHKPISDLNSVDDTTDIPIPSILEAYAIAKIERIKGNMNKADEYDALFWGPPPSLKGVRKLSGIALLEKLDNDQKKPTGQPRALFRYRGSKPMTRFFGDFYVDRDSIHTDYFDDER